MNEAYLKVKGAWKCLYRAVDKQRHTVDFLLTAMGDASAAKRFCKKAMQHNEVPDTVMMDKSDTNKAADVRPLESIFCINFRLLRGANLYC